MLIIGTVDGVKRFLFLLYNFLRNNAMMPKTAPIGESKMSRIFFKSELVNPIGYFIR